jgi:hypothetical protein
MDETIQGEPTPEWTPEAFYTQLSKLSGSGSSADYVSWHADLQSKFALHAAVKMMVDKYKPVDSFKLAEEFPHQSEKDPQRLAYTRTPADGVSNRQLVTSIGKYLARHWPHVKDNLRRDVQALFTPDEMYIVNTMEDMIIGCELGPRSCMASVYGSIPFKHDGEHQQMKLWMEDRENNEAPDWSLHPYSAYRPDLGWSMALRKSATGIDGRALIHTYGEKKVFIRTYRRHPTDPSGWSQTDFALQGWLETQGYMKFDNWLLGTKMYIPRDPSNASRRFAPYIDGERKGLSIAPDDDVAEICDKSDANYWAENTNCFLYEGDGCGDDDENDEREYCEDCEEYFHPDDMYWVGRGDDHHVCEGCRDNYTEVRGAPRRHDRGDYITYYSHENNAVEVRGQDYYIDTEHQPNNVVCLEDGDYAEVDDTVCIDGAYYWIEDNDVVALAETHPDTDDAYGLKSECWESDDGVWWASEEHYLEHNPPVEEDEEDIDPDNPDAVEVAKEEETEVA